MLLLWGHQLQHLKILTLFGCIDKLQVQMTCTSNGFPKLQLLQLWNLPIKKLIVEAGAMPCLRELEIRSCQHLGDVTGLQNVTTLKELVLTNIPNDFGAKVGKFLEDGDAYIRYNTWSSSPPFMSRRVALELIPPGVRKLWKDWDLRLTILLSLIIQILFGNRRKNNQKPWIRGLVWSAYTAADSIATFALGILSVTSLRYSTMIVAITGLDL
ncbi:hypothetical protein LWI29_028535 [Acer saccharum]|uniref:Uncharacterized protein n=1 Tax=Acer saccharum TaxID=4024 RepID=A0AA39SX33_ACESA|nr:hypothetical protein LWI29_028535 [Acer saccharum]